MFRRRRPLAFVFFLKRNKSYFTSAAAASAAAPPTPPRHLRTPHCIVGLPKVVKVNIAVTAPAKHRHTVVVKIDAIYSSVRSAPGRFNDLDALDNAGRVNVQEVHRAVEAAAGGH